MLRLLRISGNEDQRTGTRFREIKSVVEWI
jgi:hypothetical protein